MTAKTPEPLYLDPYKAWADAPWGPEPDTPSEMVAALVVEVDRLRAEIAVLDWRIRRERAARRTDTQACRDLLAPNVAKNPRFLQGNGQRHGL